MRSAPWNCSSCERAQRGDSDPVKKITPSNSSVHSEIVVGHASYFVVGITKDEPSLIDDGHVAVVDFKRV